MSRIELLRLGNSEKKMINFLKVNILKSGDGRAGKLMWLEVFLSSLWYCSGDIGIFAKI